MGDTPKIKEEMGKLTEDAGDHLLFGLGASSKIIRCHTCGINLTDSKTYKSHLQGKKHQKKVAEEKLMNETNDDEEEDDDDDDDSNELHCKLCNMKCSSYLTYDAHVKGRIHAKHLKKEKLKEQMGSLPETFNQKENDDGIQQKIYGTCEICQYKFTGIEPYEMHMKGAMHKSKVKQAKAVQILKAQNEKVGNNSADEVLHKKCDICKKSFSGIIPYFIHMESKIHQRNTEKKKLAEELTDYCTKDNMNSSFTCKECNKVFPDPFSMKSHLKNNSHEKQKAKSALLEFLSTHPDIVVVYPLDEVENEDDSDSADSSPKYYLICKLCHVSLSGPKSAEDHVKSSKHASLKKEKKLRVLTKQNQNSVKSEKKSSKTKTDDMSSAKKISENGKSKSHEDSHPNNAEGFELI